MLDFLLLVIIDKNKIKFRQTKVILVGIRRSGWGGTRMDLPVMSIVESEILRDNGFFIFFKLSIVIHSR
jgi:hypothetical protein